jgi:hypothetical protein
VAGARVSGTQSRSRRPFNFPKPVRRQGIWGTRVADLAARYGGDVIELKAEAGRSFSLAEMTKALETHKPAVLFLCQAGFSDRGWQASGGWGLERMLPGALSSRQAVEAARTAPCAS